MRILVASLALCLMLTSCQGQGVDYIAGVIRNTGGGWQLIDNVDHTPLNIASVETLSDGKIRINYDFAASQVISFTVTPDETYIRYGLTAGARASLDYAMITLSAPLRFYYDTGTGHIVNNFIFGDNVYESEIGMDYVEFTHPPVYGNTMPVYSKISSTSEKQLNITFQPINSTTTRMFISTDLEGQNSAINNGQFVAPAGFITIDLGVAEVDANDVQSVTGNLWIMGIVQ